MHRDLVAFDFESSRVDQALIVQLAGLEFTERARAAVFISGPGTGKAYLGTAVGEAGVTKHRRRARFFSTIVWSTLLSGKRPGDESAE